jgi:hypothetical protein
MAKKIEGGPPPVAGVDRTSEVQSIDPTAPVEPAQPASGAGAIDPIAKIAGRLRAGEIDADQAVELLIDDAVRRQLGRATDEKPELAGKLRELLRQHAASDPNLAAHIRRLTQGK